MANSTVQESVVSLEELSKQEVIRQIPLFIFLFLIAIFGSAGNILVLYVYKLKYVSSSCRTFVLFLSAVDLFSASVGIPVEILFLFYEFDFRLIGLCKLSVFLNSWPTLTSGFVLVAIAVDRYRKICKPFMWQIKPKIAIYVCMFCAILAFTFSWISPVIYGIKQSENSRYNLNVSECAVTDDMHETVLPVINNVSFALLFVGALVSMSVMYIFIVLEIKAFAKRRIALQSGHFSVKSKKMVQISPGNSQNNLSSLSRKAKPWRSDIQNSGSDALFCSESTESKRIENSDTEEETAFKTRKDGDGEVDMSDTERPKSGIASQLRKSWLSKSLLSLGRRNCEYSIKKSNSSPSMTKEEIVRTKNKQSKDSNRQKAHKTATIMLRVTLGFVISYLPLLCILLIRTSVSGFVASLSDGERALYKFFLRSYYLSCAINPVIYGMSDGRFRKTVRKVLHRFKGS